MSWFQHFSRIWPLPDSYLTIDVETSGLKCTEDYLCTFGYAIVHNRAVHQTGYIVLNWYLDPKLDKEEFTQDLLKTEERMRELGKNFFHTPTYLQQFGMQPRMALEAIHQVLMNARNAGYPLAGFNGYNFDANFIQAHILDFLSTDYMIGDDEMFDLGMMEKACQLSLEDEPLPKSGESKRAWAFRIGKLRRRGVTWSLDKHCMPKYDLSRRCSLPPEMAHRSDFDAVCLHHLFEQYRQLVTAA